MLVGIPVRTGHRATVHYASCEMNNTVPVLEHMYHSICYMPNVNETGLSNCSNVH